MVTLLKLHDGPQKVMRKRDKRLMDYTRFKAIKDRGDKPDKKTVEQGEQFGALNDALKDELPKLYALTAKLVEACLKNFIQIQVTWFGLLQTKLGHLTSSFPDNVQEIINDWSEAFTSVESQVLTLGVCNGSVLADVMHNANYSSHFSGPTAGSPGRPSTVNSANTRMGSVDESPKISLEFGRAFYTQSFDSHRPRSKSRTRTDSAISGRNGAARAPESTDQQRGQALQQVASNASTEQFPRLPSLELNTPLLDEVLGAGSNESAAPPPSPGARYSGFFSSAMPMSDSPRPPAEAEGTVPREPKVLFLAASIYEFNIDRSRREAGYPYLTYVAGEIFDVIAEKGELWLAKNQDDPTCQVGWIWNKHFAKLAA